MPWTSGTITRKTQLASLEGGATKTLFDAESAAIVAGNYFLYVRELPVRVSWRRPSIPTTFQLGAAPSSSATTTSLSSGTPATPWRRHRHARWSIRRANSAEPVDAGSAGPGGRSGRSAIRTCITTRRFRRWHDAGDREGRPDLGATDLWTVDLARGVFSRLTSSPGSRASRRGPPTAAGSPLDPTTARDRSSGSRTRAARALRRRSSTADRFPWTGRTTAAPALRDRWRRDAARYMGL